MNNLIKEITRWQVCEKLPLSIHASDPHKPFHYPTRQKNDKRYYLTVGLKDDYLTQRELDVALLLVEGLTYKNIGKVLGITGRTIECYVNHLRVKFECRNKKTLITRLNELNISKLCDIAKGKTQ